MLLLHLADHPLPERKWLRVWIVHAKHTNSLRDPVVENALQLRPQLSRAGALKIERVNILILLRRIFRVLHRSVRPLAEPFAMLFDVWMIGRALKCDIK